MGALTNTRQERFAQELAKGQTADAAYRLAGYRANRGNASALKAKQNIKDRLAELMSAAAQTTGITIATITAKLDEAFVMAKDRGQPTAMIGAAVAQARIHGLVREVPAANNITVNGIAITRIVRIVVDPDAPTVIERG